MLYTKNYSRCHCRRIGCICFDSSAQVQVEFGHLIAQIYNRKEAHICSRLDFWGKMPTKVFYECGFDDYSGFYKAFVRMFGYPPSDIKNLSEV